MTRLAPRLRGCAVTGLVDGQNRFFFIHAVTTNTHRIATGAGFEFGQRRGLRRYAQHQAAGVPHDHAPQPDVPCLHGNEFTPRATAHWAIATSCIVVVQRFETG
jgi:hypothetical protein